MVKAFTLINKYDIPEQSGVLYEYVHNNTGAKLLHMETADTNKTFSVSFRTPPVDDTGVFHILEHSVLCGSDKFPVKEPFVELLKSSTNTFLNAMTFPDKTMYPVSSRNEKDLHNLMSVYLDAAFHPAIYDNPNIFYQEGWTYDYPKAGGDICYRGVVFNEMKGAESALDTLMHKKLMKLIYPDVCYGHTSGGDPRAITDLTYEQFIETHRRCYAPANAIFYLEGNLDAAEAMKMIDEALEGVPTDRPAVQFQFQEEVEPVTVTSQYPISEGEPTDKKTKVAFGKLHGIFDDKDYIYSTMLLCAYLTDSNQAPLARTILGKGLAEDVRINLNDGLYQLYLQISLENTNPECMDDIKAAVLELREHFAEHGIPASDLEPTLNNIEFEFRDGMEPKGLIHNMMVLNSYLYGGDPSTFLRYNDTFKFMREQLSTDYYKNLVMDMLDIDKYSAVVMVPSDTLGAEDESEETAKVEAASDSWTEDEEQAMVARTAELAKWHDTPDTPENLDKIPKLTLADIGKEPIRRVTVPSEYGTATILEHPSELDGISYVNMYFPIHSSDLAVFSHLAIAGLLFAKLPTKNKELFRLMQEIKSNMGALEFAVDTLAPNNAVDQVGVYFIVNFTCLTQNLEKAKSIIEEVLFETDFTSDEYVEQVLLQDLNDFRDDIIQSGSRMGMKSVCAGLTKASAVKEATDGVTCYKILKDIVDNFEEKKHIISDMGQLLRQEIMVRNEMVCSITTRENGRELAKPFVDMFPVRETPTGEIEHEGKHGAKNFVRIPAAVSYAAAGNNMTTVGASYNGAWKVAAKIISLEYLWQEVRVKGGAYGCNCTVGPSGNVIFTSYRDPNGVATFDVFKGAGAFLRDFAEHNDLDSYIISTIADTEPLMSPRHIAETADFEYLRGVGYEYSCMRREEMLGTTKEQLIEIADALDAMWEGNNYCLVSSDGDDFEADTELTV